MLVHRGLLSPGNALAGAQLGLQVRVQGCDMATTKPAEAPMRGRPAPQWLACKWELPTRATRVASRPTVFSPLLPSVWVAPSASRSVPKAAARSGSWSPKPGLTNCSCMSAVPPLGGCGQRSTRGSMGRSGPRAPQAGRALQRDFPCPTWPGSACSHARAASCSTGASRPREEPPRLVDGHGHRPGRAAATLVHATRRGESVICRSVLDAPRQRGEAADLRTQGAAGDLSARHRSCTCGRGRADSRP